MSVTVLTNENFQKEVMDNQKTVLIDFWASWCGPCKMLSPIVDEFAEENPNISVCKVNVDEQPDLSTKFAVMSIPTLIVFKNGQQVNQSVGLITKEAIAKLVN